MADDPALADFRELIALGTARGGALLTAGERTVVERMLALHGPPAILYARLTGRVRPAFRVAELVVRGVDDVAAAGEALCEAGLADPVVPASLRAACSTRTRLAAACRALGLPTGGRKVDLVARLRDRPRWDGDAWLRIRHRALVRRLEQWALLDAFPDRGTLVVARLGVVRWPDYALTSGPTLFRDRRALLRWEALLADPTAPTALAALADGSGAAPARLDLRRLLVRRVREDAIARERADPAGAAAAYSALAATGTVRAGTIAVRWARCVERAGDPAGALAVLRRARAGDVLPSEDVAIGKAGRRLGRRLRAGLAPAPPLARPLRRTLALEPAGVERGRPRWIGTSGPVVVEAAVREHLAAAGRRSIRAEAGPWATLFAVLCAELYFLPVPDALPVPFLAGPLDLGTAQFRPARAAACDALLADIDAGRGPERVRAADARWRGARLAGARWDSADPEVLAVLAEGLGGGGLRALVETLLDGGPRRAVGMPDLAVLPGPEVRLVDAHPTRIAPTLVLVEVKGPGDTPRDEQQVWHDRLVRAGVPVELWEVGPKRAR